MKVFKDEGLDILHYRQLKSSPRVSFVLLDWSCRESLHTLDYLAEQDVPRDCYEIVWIEYFNRRDSELQQRLDDASRDNAADPVDTWIVMDMPADVCHHKHLMYNIGIVASRGELVCFCDSDAMARPGFVRSILDAFDRDSEIVLHHDEVRNRSPRFYPFRYPTFDDVLGPGCNNWVNGRTVGLWDTQDPLHTRNYGASMTARRDDLIAIGGADMHPDYLGHVCGPYELTFRLTNAGRREVWCTEEVLYHTWHPGQAGSVDYCGPHDGRHMSTTALEALASGRVLPLEENAAIETLRTRTFGESALEDQLRQAVNPEWLTAWTAVAIAARPARDATRHEPPTVSEFDRRLTRLQQLRLLPLVMALLMKQYRIKYDKLRHAAPFPSNRKTAAIRRVLGTFGSLIRKVRGAYGFLPAATDYTKYLIRTCWLHLAYAKSRGLDEIQVFGDSQTTAICLRLAGISGIRVVAVHDAKQIHESELPVLVAAFANGRRFQQQLLQLGVSDDRIVSMT